MVVTLKHIANRTGVSWQTVSRILNNKGHLFRPETCEKVQRVAKEMGYVPNATARNMRNQSARQVGVLLRNAPSHTFHNMAVFATVLGINARLEDAGYLLNLVRLAEVQNSDHSRSRVFEERLLDGMIIVSMIPPEIQDQLTTLMPRNIWVDSNIWEKTNCLRRDENQVCTLLAKRILQMGYRKVLWVTRSQLGPTDKHSHYSFFEREEALFKQLANDGIETHRMRIRPIKKIGSLPLDFQKYLQRDWAIVAYDHHVAQVIQSTAAAWRCVPGYDFGLFCCDESPESRESWSGICRVSNDRYAMGFKAADMMLTAIHHPKKLVASQRMGGQWVIGDTAWGPESSD